MDYEFNSQAELFKRVRPALRAKNSELERLGFGYIKDIDIWNYLIDSKWKMGKDLMLSDIVNDIMSVNSEEVDNYIKDNHITKSSQDFEDLEII